MHQERTISPTIEDVYEHRRDYNILYPLKGDPDTSPLYRIKPKIWRIDPNPSKGEVFKVRTSRGLIHNLVDGYSLATPVVEELARIAGIMFDPVNSRRTDDSKNTRRVEFQATAALRGLDGTWIIATQTKEFDLDAIEREIRLSLEEEARRGQLRFGEGKREVCKFGTMECSEEINRRMGAKMNQLEKDKVAIAETGARNRVIRTLLGVKPSYRKDELRKPFVVFQISLNTELILRDPDLKGTFLLYTLASPLTISIPWMLERSLTVHPSKLLAEAERLFSNDTKKTDEASGRLPAAQSSRMKQLNL